MERKRINIIYTAKETYDGAGVKLKRVFGGMRSVTYTDPFLLLDNFGSSNPEDYIMGFPWHPHRGIETVTYMLNGTVEHEDSEGNRGIIRPGEIQWMTAGSGIFHQEMPKPFEDRISLLKDNTVSGFQLWINLPASLKMTRPAYRSIKPDSIPSVDLDEGGKVKVIAGKYKNYEGALNYGGLKASNYIEPIYMDVNLEPEASFSYSVKPGFKAIIYPFVGYGLLNGMRIDSYRAYVLSEEGEQIDVKAGDMGVRFLLLAGKPIKERVAWYGPIVMNTQEQLEQAFLELSNGTFIKHREPEFL
ncbi:Pirin-related protein [Caldisphaera lagunensis DSM 15908]|uniref:Pirin-related protein n=1 Tax=Caldisphaera lagunensis (strain DSM 15908 / JCM 11604 / ANMR 0165 / IC-154) TaxID=1056495 RepID=L0A868_CALLD|nr:pirin family protein [Caldisphaera lagunensis]AFZ70063.1 Pirin-related protein [Caldisphaera lagunensis DSM 15908]